MTLNRLLMVKIFFRLVKNLSEGILDNFLSVAVTADIGINIFNVMERKFKKQFT